MSNNTSKIIDIHTHDDKIINSAGIHPWDLERLNNDSVIIQSLLAKLKKQLEQPKIIFLGEIGLDRAKKMIDFELQKNVFLAQLELNNSYFKPVVIHAVRSSSDILEMRKRFKHQTWIIHGFRENKEIAKALLSAGCYLSFGANLITTNTLQNIFKELPLTSLFLETDAQKDYSIEEIYYKVAKIKAIPLDELIKVLYENFNKIIQSKGV